MWNSRDLRILAAYVYFNVCDWRLGTETDLEHMVFKRHGPWVWVGKLGNLLTIDTCGSGETSHR